jgi:hypothetical protein
MEKVRTTTALLGGRKLPPHEAERRQKKLEMMINYLNVIGSIRKAGRRRERLRPDNDLRKDDQLLECNWLDRV